MADTKSSKSLSLPLVLQTLRVHNGISRIEISRLLNLDRSTITNIVSRLEKEGLVKTLSTGISAPNKGGRKPLLIGLNPEYGGVLGLEIQDDHYKAVFVDLNGQEYFRQTGLYDGKSEDLSSSLSALFNQLNKEIRKTGLPLIGIGLGLPGHIDPMQKTVIQSRVHHLTNQTLTLPMESIAQVPFCIDNDANCCAWSQIELSKKNSSENFLVLILKSARIEGSSARENELGIGVVVGGKVYYGADFSAGEFPGHAAKEISAVISRESQSENKGIIRGLFDHLDLLFSIFNPETVLLSGDFLLTPDISSQIEEYTQRLQPDHPLYKKPIQLAEKGDYDVPFGSASMFLEHLFSLPDFSSQTTSSQAVSNQTGSNQNVSSHKKDSAINASQREAENRSKITWENIFSLKQNLGHTN